MSGAQSAPVRVWQHLASSYTWLVSSESYQRTSSVKANSDTYERTASVRYHKTHSERAWMEHYQALAGGPKRQEAEPESVPLFQRMLALVSWSGKQKADVTDECNESMGKGYERTHSQKNWQEHAEALER